MFGVERGPINGIAPGAWLSVYKVCGIQGCFASDSAAAVQQAMCEAEHRSGGAEQTGMAGALQGRTVVVMNLPAKDPVTPGAILRRGRSSRIG